jgi:hypothetical protein
VSRLLTLLKTQSVTKLQYTIEIFELRDYIKGQTEGESEVEKFKVIVIDSMKNQY